MSDRSLLAFVLDRRPSRENDLMVVLLLDDGTRTTVYAPGAQRSRHRYMAGLNPLSLYRIGLTDSPRGPRLDDARIERTWPGLAQSLPRHTAALTATGIARSLADHTATDRAMFLLLGELYSACETITEASLSAAALVRFTFDCLDHTGHSLALDHCVRCLRLAPENSRVTVDPRSGGVVCRHCGGGPLELSAADRTSLRAVRTGDFSRWQPSMLDTLSRLIEGISPDASAVIFHSIPVFSLPTIKRP